MYVIVNGLPVALLAAAVAVAVYQLIRTQP